MFEFLGSTHIVERFCGGTLYIAMLVYFYTLIRRTRKYQSLRVLLNVYTVVLTVMAFFFVPSNTTDLYRLLEYGNGWKSMTFLAFFKEVFCHIMYPVSALLIYLNGRLGNGGLLPAFCALVVYANIFYILKDLHKNHGCQTHVLAEVLLSVMVTGAYMEVISGIRCFLALTLLARCYYDQIYNHKKSVALLLVQLLAAMIHPMAIAFLAIRAVFALVQSRGTFRQRVFVAIFVVAACALAWRYGQSYIIYTINKSFSYIQSQPYRDLWETMINILQIIVFFMVLRCARKMTQEDQKQEHLSFLKFCQWFWLIAVVFSFEYSISHRTCYFLSVLIMPVLAECFADKRNVHTRNIAMLLFMIMMVLAVIRGNLSGYKFFVF